MERQRSLFVGAHPKKRDLAHKELEFYAEHLQLYSEKVLQDIKNLKSNSRFKEYSALHEKYWATHLVEKEQPQQLDMVSVDR
jgi:hypothetical protein